jgi:hypothetical protein
VVFFFSFLSRRRRCLCRRRLRSSFSPSLLLSLLLLSLLLSSPLAKPESKT